ncbi:hypothetical protein PFICI_13856 [Pestalotiopsis fici W106-1]|uniref:Uncharacterized protein n=1 Tax=Pestalotiopsis fici (strain W106-1 / CGMCC3.15140) TaxID=1229662 RepID=W3WJ85_PESFW|nr:uncharacterized protein PFICI_13856 [Pestalotiopsis fici W106-1]ETS73990.1 hypothetical protein PFICI_13856 [Pestalotiopsis fici W106-1]
MRLLSLATIVMGIALSLGVLVPLVGAIPLKGAPLQLLRALERREPPSALPEKATDDQKKFQPIMDFDQDGCYNTPAIDSNNKTAGGLRHDFTGGEAACRDASDLLNNNVYVRTRCNGGWCGHVYDYYFEKDVAVQHFFDVGGHRHEWEHIVVFVKNDVAEVVAVSQHGDYDTWLASDATFQDGTHPMVVYHKEGGSTHAFRMADRDDWWAENHSSAWYLGPLIDYDTGFPDGVRDVLVNHDFGRATMAIKDGEFKKNLDYARNNLVEGFDSG